MLAHLLTKLLTLLFYLVYLGTSYQYFNAKYNETDRFDSEKAGDREVQRTMLELLNQLDGFEPNNDIKVVFISV